MMIRHNLLAFLLIKTSLGTKYSQPSRNCPDQRFQIRSWRGIWVFSTCIRPGEHDFGAFSQSFQAQVRVSGSGGQISKVSPTLQNLYHIVQFDELSWMVQYFSDLLFLSQVTAKNNATIPKTWVAGEKAKFTYIVVGITFQYFHRTKYMSYSC